MGVDGLHFDAAVLASEKSISAALAMSRHVSPCLALKRGLETPQLPGAVTDATAPESTRNGRTAMAGILSGIGASGIAKRFMTR